MWKQTCSEAWVTVTSTAVCVCVCVSANQTLGAVFTGSQVCRVNCSIVHHCCQPHLCRCFVFIEPANAKTQWLEFSAKMSYYTDRDPSVWRLYDG